MVVVGGGGAALAANSMGNTTERQAQSCVKVSDGCPQCNLTRDCTWPAIVTPTSVAWPRKMSVCKCLLSSSSSGGFRKSLRTRPRVRCELLTQFREELCKLTKFQSVLK